MKTRYMSLVLGAAIITLSSAALALPCGEGMGSCPWSNDHVDFKLTDKADTLTLTTTVQGCASMRAAHQDMIAEKIAKATKGEACCDACPFAAKGLKYKLEKTDLGTIVTITGPAESRAEFKKLFNAKMAARKAGTGCGNAEGSSGCQKHKGSSGAAKVEKKSCGCGK
ncbi:MAG: hypothetical protein GXP54_02120 [Deltaproteobacteria bacterium]|nr:hypothetical protein [Deltaproteobacteria bacterium]